MREKELQKEKTELMKKMHQARQWMQIEKKTLIEINQRKYNEFLLHKWEFLKVKKQELQAQAFERVKVRKAVSRLIRLILILRLLKTCLTSCNLKIVEKKSVLFEIKCAKRMQRAFRRRKF